jgi:uncharacterized protein YbaR (Trm112 family)
MLDLIVCPRCRGSLTLLDDAARSAGVSCNDCGRTYPHIDTIPLLFEDPKAWVTRWERQIADFVRDNADVRAKILAQMTAESTLERTRARLERLHVGLEAHATRVLAVLAQAGLHPGEAADPRKAQPTTVPGEGTITAYYHQLHRDWGWDGTQNTEAMQMAAAVKDVLGDTPLGKTLVLGAGGCRLPHDLHRDHGGTQMVAIDVNPLPFFVARRVIAGQDVRLFELPLRPRHTERVCVDRVLRRHGPATQGIELVFADGLDPPVRPGAFDTVFTPWFIDQIPNDAATLMPMLRNVLAPGGRWLNFGPLIYHPAHTRLAHRYCVDEILELARAWGFEMQRHSYRRMSYMESPDGTQGRTEHVLVSLARKSEAEPPNAAKGEPTQTWLDDPKEAVPRLPGLDGYRAPHPMFEAVVALIDGQRSTAEIAALLVERHGLPSDAATIGVQACLREIHRALRP